MHEGPRIAVESLVPMVEHLVRAERSRVTVSARHCLVVLRPRVLVEMPLWALKISVVLSHSALPKQFKQILYLHHKLSGYLVLTDAGSESRALA